MRKIYYFFVFLILPLIGFSQPAEYLILNGTESIKIPNTKNINTGTLHNRTVEFWFKADALPSDDKRYLIYEEGGNVRGINFWTYNGRLYLGMYNDKQDGETIRWYGTWFRSGVLSANTWYHVALVLDNGQSSTSLTADGLKWYLNGVLQDSRNGGALHNHPGDIQLASDEVGVFPKGATWSDSPVVGSQYFEASGTGDIVDEGTERFKGAVGLLKIWNSARSAQEIEANKNVKYTTSDLNVAPENLVAFLNGNHFEYVADDDSSKNTDGKPDGNAGTVVNPDLCIWHGGTDDNWNDASNWDKVPTDGDDVQIDKSSGGSDPTLPSSDLYFNTLVIKSGNIFDIKTTNKVQVYNEFLNFGELKVQGGGSINLHSTINEDKSVITVNDGTIQNTETITNKLGARIVLKEKSKLISNEIFNYGDFESTSTSSSGLSTSNLEVTSIFVNAKTLMLDSDLKSHFVKLMNDKDGTMTVSQAIVEVDSLFQNDGSASLTGFGFKINYYVDKLGKKYSIINNSGATLTLNSPICILKSDSPDGIIYNEGVININDNTAIASGAGLENMLTGEVKFNGGINKVFGDFINEGKIIFDNNSTVTFDGDFINNYNLDALWNSTGCNITITGDFIHTALQFNIREGNTIIINGNMLLTDIQDNFILGNGTKSSLTVDRNLANKGKLTIHDNSVLNVGGDILNDGTILDQINSKITVNGSLSNQGIFTIKSNENGTGSLITKGTVSNSGTMTVQRWIDDSDKDGVLPNNNKWHLVSSPVSGALSGIFKGHFLNYLDNSYVDPNDSKNYSKFLAYRSTVEPLVIRGYVTRYDGRLPDSTPNPIEFIGDFNTDDLVSIDLSESSEGNDYFGLPGKFNLVANPYPSNIDFDKVASDNSTLITPTLYYYVHGNSSTAPQKNGWQVYNTSDNTDKNYVGVGQALGVVLKSGVSSGKLVYNNNQRTHEHAAGSGFNKKKTSDVTSFVLKAEAGNYYDEIELRENRNSTISFDDNFDAYKLNSFGEAPTPSFISEDGKRLARCVTPSVESVDLGFNMAVSGEVTFSLSNVNDFTEIILEDKQEGVFTDLIKNAYTFNYSDEDAETGRFTIHFKKEALSEVEELTGFKVYADRDEIYLKSDKALENVNVELYNLSGQVVLSNHFESLKTKNIQTDLSGVFILKISSNSGNITTKLILN